MMCIELGVMSRGRLGPLQLISEYVTHKLLIEVRNRKHSFAELRIEGIIPDTDSP